LIWHCSLTLMVLTRDAAIPWSVMALMLASMVRAVVTDQGDPSHSIGGSSWVRGLGNGSGLGEVEHDKGM
jgi:hypothetical protein